MTRLPRKGETSVFLLVDTSVLIALQKLRTARELCKKKSRLGDSQVKTDKNTRIREQ